MGKIAKLIKKAPKPAPPPPPPPPPAKPASAASAVGTAKAAATKMVEPGVKAPDGIGAVTGIGRGRKGRRKGVRGQGYSRNTTTGLGTTDEVTIARPGARSAKLLGG